MHTSIDNIRIPLMIPKRSRGGHVETTCSISVDIPNAHTESINVVQCIITKAHAVLDLNLLHELATTIREKLFVDSFKIEVSYCYCLDRVSPNYTATMYEFPCTMSLTTSKHYLSTCIGVQLPIRVRENMLQHGSITTTVSNPKSFTTEDLIDHVQKYTHSKLYPVTCNDDALKLTKIIDNGLPVLDYVSNIKESLRTRNVGSCGTITIQSTDLYNMYNIKHNEVW